MRGLRPQSYVVTLDQNSDARFRKEGLTPIVTDGVHFLLNLKKRLLATGLMVADSRFEGVARFLEKVTKDHQKTANTLDAKKYPEVIYTLSYQDGLMDGLRRILDHEQTGYYSDPDQSRRIAWTYHNAVRPKAVRAKNYCDAAYIDGYADGHIYLEIPDDARKGAPTFYISGRSKSVRTFEELEKILSLG